MDGTEEEREGGVGTVSSWTPPVSSSHSCARGTTDMRAMSGSHVCLWFRTFLDPNPIKTPHVGQEVFDVPVMIENAPAGRTEGRKDGRTEGR